MTLPVDPVTPALAMQAAETLEPGYTVGLEVVVPQGATAFYMTIDLAALGDGDLIEVRWELSPDDGKTWHHLASATFGAPIPDEEGILDTVATMTTELPHGPRQLDAAGDVVPIAAPAWRARLATVLNGKPFTHGVLAVKVS